MGHRFHGEACRGNVCIALFGLNWFRRGAEVILDLGTFTCNGSKALRNEMGSNELHSWIAIDNVDESSPGNVVMCNEIAHAKCVHVKTSEVLDSSSGNVMPAIRPGALRRERVSYESIILA